MILEVVKNDFSEKLQLIRKNRGLTLEELAEKLSVSRQAVAKWKSGQVYPEITNLIQISNLLDAGSAEVFCTILHWCFPGLFPKYRCEITLTGKRQGSRNYRAHNRNGEAYSERSLFFCSVYRN